MVVAGKNGLVFSLFSSKVTVYGSLVFLIWLSKCFRKERLLDVHDLDVEHHSWKDGYCS